MRWQAHVYGEPRGSAEASRRDHNVPLTVFAWSEAHAAAGLKKDALYLVRPDSYVALAAEDGQGLERYFADHEIQP